MKVVVRYCLEITKEIEMTPEEYCTTRANFQKNELFPKDSFNKTLEIDEQGKQELTNFFFSKNS